MSARKRPCYLELNSQPSRLDLDDVLARAAVDSRVLISFATDAHQTTDFAYVDGGITQARRGWLGPEQILNTLPIVELRKLLRKTFR